MTCIFLTNINKIKVIINILIHLKNNKFEQQCIDTIFRKIYLNVTISYNYTTTFKAYNYLDYFYVL